MAATDEAGPEVADVDETALGARLGRVAVVGSLNMDLVARAPRLPRPGETLAGHAFAQVAGGKGGNQAVAAARLGADVAMIGCVGADPNGELLRAGLVAERIDCAALETAAHASTGVALIVVDDASQNAIVIVAGSNGEVTPATIARHEAALARADVVVCQLETPPDAVRAALATARRLGKTTILNPAPATGPLPDDWLPLVDWLVPNELEAAALTGLQVTVPGEAAQAAVALRGAGANNVLVTLGAQGVCVLIGDAPAEHWPAPRVAAVDTTAAGDTFIGGFAARIAAGVEPRDAIRFAQRAAALSVTRAGAQPSIPTLDELA
ncbi:ribokinase [Paraburkholderia caballeronis]|uniref:Ribokinase n=1 Tax=Paraburkholderia caballeronis TaxID=416943 RepID=A0A1H7J0L3_9BURK|nr:ribokinase [Paraburkholderia caballeronis]PXW27612.1 ribokinase [Paraburkholderia caballeronis]PXX03086.1 ribokinase [Paraburkholderia caballeronis]RAK03811.1 ribokinase [Paraburkholderia caballeronis]TDV21015.1 ribokinase [Paraburkholderia caballeronis]TDV21444.1 ribokinase [Paraburkholderia caballeronis]